MEHETARLLAATSMDKPIGVTEERDLALHNVTCPPCKTHFVKLQELRGAWSMMKLAPSTELVAEVVERSVAVLKGLPDPKSVENAEAFQSRTTDVAIAPAPPPPVVSETTTASAVERVVHDTVQPLPSTPPTNLAPPTATEAIPIGAPPTTPPQAPGAWPTPTETPIPTDGPAASVPVGFAPSPTDALPKLSGPPAQNVAPSTVPPAMRIDSTQSDRPPFAPITLEEPETDDRKSGLATAIVLILIAVATAAAAWLFLNRVSTTTPEDTLPTAASVVASTVEALSGIESLSAEFEISRLDLYRFGDSEKPTTTFAVAKFEGEMSYDASGNLREEITLNVADAPPVSTTSLTTGGIATSYTQLADGRSLATDTRPALGPPAGPHRSNLGILERSIGTTVNAMAQADDLEVLTIETHDGGDVLRMMFTLEPDPVLRADRIIVYIDQETSFPVRVEKSISRANARVLGSEDLLSETNLDTSFGGSRQVVTESVEITKFDLNGTTVTPTDFVFDAPEGVESDAKDSGFEAGELAEAPTFSSLPDGYNLVAFSTEPKPTKWGPDDDNVAPDSVSQYGFFNGRTTVVADVRRFEVDDPDDDPPTFTGAPFEVGSFNLVTQTAKVGEVDFTFATSPEIVPVLYGQSGEMYITVSGWAPVDVLAAFAAAMLDESTGATDDSTEPDPLNQAEPTANPVTDSAVSDRGQSTRVDPGDEQNPNIP